MSKKKMPAREDPAKRFSRAFEHMARRRNGHDIFRDFVAASAIALEQRANQVFGRFDQATEDRYLAIVKRYDRDDVARFPEMLAAVASGSEDGRDFLGQIYMDLEIQNKWIGQFFTPWPVAMAMTRINCPDPATDVAKAENGIVTVMEPACGSGVMILAFAENFREHGMAPERHINATMIDLDRLCADIAYIQTSFSGIPATVMHGNSLSLEIFETRRNLPLLLQQARMAMERVNTPAGAERQAAE